MLRNCESCKHFNKDNLYSLGGICLLSQSGKSKLMVACDEVSENRPYLEVSPEFGCNQHEVGSDDELN